MSKYDLQQIKDSLTPDDIFNLLSYLHGDPYKANSEEVVSKTICHNGESHKLHYYNNSKLFQCYTECGDPFDVFTLLQKVRPISIDTLGDAIEFLVDFFNLYYLNDSKIDSAASDLQVFDDYTTSADEDGLFLTAQDRLELSGYDATILNNFPTVSSIQEWHSQYISSEVCESFNIKYDSTTGSIIIPHYDISDNCVGIRRRTLDPDEVRYGKYRPWYHNKTLYSHPLGMSLYGIDKAVNGIAKSQRAIVVEGEKGVLQFCSYYGMENDCCVAVCGSSMTWRQFKILFDLGITELVVAFDRDYQKGVYSNEYYEVRNKIQKLCRKFMDYVTISYIFDSKGMLHYKDSPLDRGKEVFERLFETRSYI